MTAIYIEDRKISLKELLELIEKKEIQDPIFPVTKTLDCVISILSCLIKKIPFFPHSPHLPQKPKVDIPKGCDFILHTSGSSKMKFALFKKQALLHANICTHPSFYLKRGDVYLLNLPLYHVAGLSILIRGLLRGGSIAIDPVDQNIITHLSIVPAMAENILKNRPYPNLKAMLIGGSEIKEDLALSLIDANYPLYISYGMTEMSSHIFVKKYEKEEGVCFLNPLPKREIKLKKDGSLLVKGCGKFIRYLDMVGSQWINTKDIFKRKNGKLYFVKRADKMFISGGENIFPEEIERALLTHPNVKSVNLTIIEHLKWGQRPFLRVFFKDNPLSKEQIQKYLLSKIEKFKVPKDHEIEICTEFSSDF
jgi:acyl-CoA synthetase (AMP-forming)/AMP-acid ligase II